MADLINLGCDCCSTDGCNFGCDPCINSVTISACGYTTTFAWPEQGTTGCGNVYRTQNTTRCTECAGGWFTCPDEQSHFGCTHGFRACLGEIPGSDTLLYTETQSPANPTCQWTVELRCVAVAVLYLDITFKTGRKADVTIICRELFTIYSKFIFSGECCSDTKYSAVFMQRGALELSSYNTACYPCPNDLSGVSPPYLWRTHGDNGVRYEQEIEFSSCSDFWNEKEVEYASEYEEGVISGTSLIINPGAASCSVPGDCSCSYSGGTIGAGVSLSMPGLFCSSPTTPATIQFNL